MRILIISTGDELLKGQISDTNASWMAAEIFSRGQRVERVVVVGDTLPDLVDVIGRGLADYDLTLVGGGLGPTVDDLTAAAAAQAAGVPLVHDADAEIVVRARFASLHRAMPEINLKQALVPRGATVIDNPTGTAPGFIVCRGGHQAVFMPGVPAELKPMFVQAVIPLLPPPPDRHQAVFKFFGIGESAAQERLAPILAKETGIGVSFRVSFPEIALTLTAPDAASLHRLIPPVEMALQDALFARTLDPLPDIVIKRLIETGTSLAVAESCTGGFLGSTITDISGASAVFSGGVIAYDNRIKMGLLDVSSSMLEEHGAVSEPVACAMARGVSRHFSADVGVGITGIAGPGGGSAEKPVGTVHIAVWVKGAIIHRHCAFSGYNRTAVKAAAAWTALKMIYDSIGNQS